jgi:hypothetical protein
VPEARVAGIRIEFDRNVLKRKPVVARRCITVESGLFLGAGRF